MKKKLLRDTAQVVQRPCFEIAFINMAIGLSQPSPILPESDITNLIFSPQHLNQCQLALRNTIRVTAESV